MFRKQSFWKGSALLLASAMTAKLLGACFKIPLTNVLGGTGMGYFSTAYGLLLPVYAPEKSRAYRLQQLPPENNFSSFSCGLSSFFDCHFKFHFFVSNLDCDRCFTRFQCFDASFGINFYNFFVGACKGSFFSA